MIYNRTAEDVAEAIRIRKDKVQQFETLTQAEKDTLERGFITINTLNRIENKISELCDMFENDFYFVDKIEVKNWTYTDYFTGEEYERILFNIDMLRKALFVYSTTPDTPAPVYGYEQLNAVEKILVDLENTLSGIKKRYKRCGIYRCGEDSI